MYMWCLTCGVMGLDCYKGLSVNWGLNKMAAILQTIFSKVFFFKENVCILVHISLDRIPKSPCVSKSTLAQVMVQRHQATSHYVMHYWYAFMTPYGITRPQWVNLLPPVRFEWNLRKVIFKLLLVIDGSGTSCEIAIRWMPLCLTHDK